MKLWSTISIPTCSIKVLRGVVRCEQSIRKLSKKIRLTFHISYDKKSYAHCPAAWMHIFNTCFLYKFNPKKIKLIIRNTYSYVINCYVTFFPIFTQHFLLKVLSDTEARFFDFWNKSYLYLFWRWTDFSKNTYIAINSTTFWILYSSQVTCKRFLK